MSDEVPPLEPPEAPGEPVSESSPLDVSSEEADAPSAPSETLTRRERRRARRSSKRRWVLRLAILVLVLVVAAGGARLALGSPVTSATYTPSSTALEVTQPGGAPPTVNWPAQGQGAWGIPAFSAQGASANQTPLAIGSTAKMMTALVVIDEHPLSPGQAGPTLSVTAEDVAAYAFDLKDGQSRAAVEVGEKLSELQLLQGLLVHSANNYALMLAQWTAGSEEAFVAKMNEKAASLGLHATHYADASGYSPATVSTAAEQIVVAKALMASEVLSPIVRMTSVDLPVAGTMNSFTPLLSVPGVVGIKSGLTTEAGGCDVMAYISMKGGLPVMVYSAVLGQVFSTDRLATAGNEALRLAHEAEAGLVPIRVASAHEKVGELSFTTGSSAVITSSALTVPGWPGTRVEVAVKVDRVVRDGIPAGTPVGRMTVTSGAFTLTIPLVTAATIPRLSWWQRLV